MFVEMRLELQVSALGVITSQNFSEKPHNPEQHGPNSPLPLSFVVYHPVLNVMVGESCPRPPPPSKAAHGGERFPHRRAA